MEIEKKKKKKRKKESFASARRDLSRMRKIRARSTEPDRWDFSRREAEEKE